MRAKEIYILGNRTAKKTGTAAEMVGQGGKIGKRGKVTALFTEGE
jgi:hypothetical protein